jgi:hypothetical protein
MEPEDRSKYSLVGRILNANSGSETRKMAAADPRASPDEKAGPYLLVLVVIAVIVGLAIWLTR